MRQLQGEVNYLAGLAAEDAVAEHYARAGLHLAAKRWRGKAGEIDLIFSDGDLIVFAEVKAARDHARAAESLQQRQVGRLYRAAEEYAEMHGQGSLTDMRFDVALVDGQGRIEVLENAFA